MRALLIDEACVVTPSAAPNPICGTLYVVATPIGNLDDISARALTILRSVALIAAEDTRHSARLMQHFGIATPLAACHEHNERDQGGRFLARLLEGDDVALISDAGTPLVSDPGYHLVRQARAAGIAVDQVDKSFLFLFFKTTNKMRNRMMMAGIKNVNLTIKLCGNSCFKLSCR